MPTVLQRLYDNASKHYSLPPFQQFVADMQDPEKRERFRKSLGAHFSVPDSTKFAQDLLSSPELAQKKTTPDQQFKLMLGQKVGGDVVDAPLTFPGQKTETPQATPPETYEDRFQKHLGFLGKPRGTLKEEKPKSEINFSDAWKETNRRWEEYRKNPKGAKDPFLHATEPLAQWAEPRLDEPITKRIGKELVVLAAIKPYMLASVIEKPGETAKGVAQFMAEIANDWIKLVDPNSRDEGWDNIRKSPLFHVLPILGFGKSAIKRLPKMSEAEIRARANKAAQEVVDFARENPEKVAEAIKEAEKFKEAHPEEYARLFKDVQAEKVRESANLQRGKEAIKTKLHDEVQKDISTPKLTEPNKFVLKGEPYDPNVTPFGEPKKLPPAQHATGFEKGRPVRIKGAGKYGGMMGNVVELKPSGSVKVNIKGVGNRVFPTENVETSEVLYAKGDVVKIEGAGKYDGMTGNVVELKQNGAVKVKIDGVEGVRVFPEEKVKKAPEVKQSEVKKPAEMTFIEFEKEYTHAFKQAMNYSPDQVGQGYWAERMAKLAEKHPDWAEAIENRPEKREVYKAGSQELQDELNYQNVRNAALRKEGLKKLSKKKPTKIETKTGANLSQKQPWEMTRDENNAVLTQISRERIKLEKQLEALEAKPHSKNPNISLQRMDKAYDLRKKIDQLENEANNYRGHRAQVYNALSEGKPVPPEVLKDYPDFAREYGKVSAKKPPISGKKPTALRAEKEMSKLESTLANIEKQLENPNLTPLQREGLLKSKERIQELIKEDRSITLGVEVVPGLRGFIDKRARNKALAQIHIKLKELGLSDVEAKDLKVRVTGKASSEFFTPQDVKNFVNALDKMAKTPKPVPDLPGDTPTKPTVKQRIAGSFVGDALASGIARIENMGKPGKELAQRTYEYYKDHQIIRGEGDVVAKEIDKLLKGGEKKKFGAFIDPYLARAFENLEHNERTAKAKDAWQKYTDWLHDLRVKYKTYVVVDGKRVPAEETYAENWIRYELKADVKEKLLSGGELYHKEARRLIKEGKAKNMDEAEALIGEWLRESPFINAPIRYGSMDRPRLAMLSPELYETDFNILVPRIIQKSATFLAASKNFAQDMTVRDKLVGKIAVEMGHEKAKAANQILDEILTGETRSPTTRALRKATSPLITLQLSGISQFKNNILYSIPHSYAAYGIRATTQGFLKIMTDFPRLIERTRRVGQLETGVRELEHMGIWKLASRYSPMGASEVLNRMRDVHASQVAADQAARILNGSVPAKITKMLGGNINATAWAKRYLKTYGRFTESQIKEIGKRGYLTQREIEEIQALAPSLTQGSPNPMFMPKVLKNEMGAFTAPLKKMAFRATVSFWKSAVEPMRDGNFGGMTKFLIAAGASGELIYTFNYLAFGWKHPTGGNIGGFIDYLHDEPDKKKAAQLAYERFERDLMRSQGFGIVNDMFDGYGVTPYLLSKTADIENDIEHIIRGEKSVGQAGEDFAKGTISIYRDVMLTHRAHLKENHEEIVRADNVKRLGYEWKNTNKKSTPVRADDYLTERSLYYRTIKDSWFNNDPEEFRRTVQTAVEMITLQYESDGTPKGRARAKAIRGIKSVIRRLDPIVVAKNDRGKFLKSLTPQQREAVKKASEDYAKRKALLLPNLFQ